MNAQRTRVFSAAPPAHEHPDERDGGRGIVWWAGWVAGRTVLACIAIARTCSQRWKRGYSTGRITPP